MEAGYLPLWISSLLLVAVVSVFVLFSWLLFFFIMFKVGSATEPGAGPFS